tara:strand:+ start:214 stop:630 length:417 start_codon:yes stop_codon:yes gene_type:complete
MKKLFDLSKSKIKLSFYFTLFNMYLILIGSFVTLVQGNPSSFIISGGGIAILFFFHSTFKTIINYFDINNTKRVLSGGETFCYYVVRFNAFLILMSTLFIFYFVFSEGAYVVLLYAIYLIALAYSMLYYTGNVKKCLS